MSIDSVIDKESFKASSSNLIFTYSTPTLLSTKEQLRRKASKVSSSNIVFTTSTPTLLNYLIMLCVLVYLEHHPIIIIPPYFQIEAQS